MELHHLVRTGRRLLRLADPPLDDGGVLRSGIEQVEGADQRRTGHHPGRVDDGLLDVPLDGPEHRRVDDAGQDAEGVGPVQIDVARHILGQARGDDDDIRAVASLVDLLDEQIRHPPQVQVARHEQLGHPKEDFCCFLSLQRLVGVLHQRQELGQHDAALLRVLPYEMIVMEDARILQHLRFFEVGVRMSPLDTLWVVVVEQLRHALGDLVEEIAHTGN
mmetsp:Transcript_3475/g.7982  ORF Transcript_3475/g.7982 Transcript_3475/m.7982 type:complete len:219 (+) Transcript_3475:289-945(+)